MDIMRVNPKQDYCGSNQKGGAVSESSLKLGIFEKAYQIKQGDRLPDIALKYGISAQSLYKMNKDIISNPSCLSKGHYLRVPMNENEKFNIEIKNLKTEPMTIPPCV